MKVQATSSNGYTIIKVEGRIDTINAEEFEKIVTKYIEERGSKVILDCSQMNYISSSGLRAFLIIQKKMISLKGEFKLCSLQDGIKEIFDISGFSSIFSIFKDCETAMIQ